jgi:hypothetical protein
MRQISMLQVIAAFPAARKLVGCRLIAALVLMLGTGLVRAQVRIEIPEDAPAGPPFYARVDRGVQTGIVPHTEEWGAVVFYRPATCVPPQFNLLNFFDVPGAFFCQPLAVEGFAVFPNAPPPVDIAPMQAKWYGLGAVSVWFASWPEIQAAAADDVLTLSELSVMSSLMRGTADFYRETLHPDPILPDDGSVQPKLTIVAHGTLEDGRRFSLSHSGNQSNYQTNISFD